MHTRVQEPYLVVQPSSSSSSDDNIENPKDPDYIPGHASPPFKPVFHPPKFHPKKVFTPGASPAAGGDQASLQAPSKPSKHLAVKRKQRIPSTSTKLPPLPAISNPFNRIVCDDMTGNLIDPDSIQG